jgi:hypothetical protein
LEETIGRIKIIIISDDPYHTLSMHLLLAKDWRTRVLSIFACPESVFREKSYARYADLILWNLATNENFKNSLQSIKLIPNQKILLLTNNLIKHNSNILINSNLAGVLDRKEINLSLAWAADYAHRGHFVTTPRTYEMLDIRRRIKTEDMIVLSNRDYPIPFSKRQREAIVMNIILGLDHRKTSKELGITPGSSYGLISSIYKRMEIDRLLRQENSIEEYIPRQQFITEKVNKLREDVKKHGTTHVSEKLDLVFHILTCPEIVR